MPTIIIIFSLMLLFFWGLNRFVTGWHRAKMESLRDREKAMDASLATEYGRYRKLLSELNALEAQLHLLEYDLDEQGEEQFPDVSKPKRKKPPKDEDEPEESE